MNCPSPGKGRWADARNWVYDFDADLPAGLNCTFRLRDDLRTVGGAALEGARTFKFTTDGPMVVALYPYEGWELVDEEQVFLLKLDAPATKPSIEAHAHCVVDGIEEQIPLEVLSGEARAAVLKERSSLGYEYFRLLWKNGAVTNVKLRNEELDKAEERIALVRWDLRGATQDAELFHTLAGELANSRRWPQWRPDSEFHLIRKRSDNDRSTLQLQ